MIEIGRSARQAAIRVITLKKILKSEPWQQRKSLLLLVATLILGATSTATAQSIDIREWLIPWERSTASHPLVDANGLIWFIGQRGNFIANFEPISGDFNRYDLGNGVGPYGLARDSNRNFWFSTRKGRSLGFLNPGTATVDEFRWPDRKARGARSVVADAEGFIWTSIDSGNFIGRTNAISRETELLSVPQKNAAPHALAISPAGVLWGTAARTNALLRIDRDPLAMTLVIAPNEATRPRGLSVATDESVWFTDFDLGELGRYDPASGEFAQWSFPGGAESKPLGIAADRNGVIWAVETGSDPSRLIGFDSATGDFLNETDIPSGGGIVETLQYHEATGEIWFVTETNYIGRAKVH